MKPNWPRKRVIKLLFVAAGRDVAMENGLKLGLAAGTLRTWFSRWRWGKQ